MYAGSPPTYGKTTRGFPGMLAPRYQELHVGAVYMVPTATALTCATHESWPSRVGSTVVYSWSRAYARHAPIHSTCCSLHTTMLASTDGLPGPDTVKRFGNPAIWSP